MVRSREAASRTMRPHPSRRARFARAPQDEGRKGAPPKAITAAPSCSRYQLSDPMSGFVSLRPQIRYPVTESQSRGPAEFAVASASNRPFRPWRSSASVSRYRWSDTEPTPPVASGKGFDGHVDNSVDNFAPPIDARHRRLLTINSYRIIGRIPDPPRALS